jgi:hypothetical protein
MDAAMYVETAQGMREIQIDADQCAARLRAHCGHDAVFTSIDGVGAEFAHALAGKDLDTVCAMVAQYAQYVAEHGENLVTALANRDGYAGVTCDALREAIWHAGPDVEACLMSAFRAEFPGLPARAYLFADLRAYEEALRRDGAIIQEDWDGALLLHSVDSAP